MQHATPPTDRSCAPCWPSLGCLAAAGAPRAHSAATCLPCSKPVALHLPSLGCLTAAGSPLVELPKGQQFSFDAPSYLLELGDQGPFASPLLRVQYSSLTQPLSVFDINMASGGLVLRLRIAGAAHLPWTPRHTQSAVPAGGPVGP